MSPGERASGTGRRGGGRGRGALPPAPYDPDLSDLKALVNRTPEPPASGPAVTPPPSALPQSRYATVPETAEPAPAEPTPPVPVLRPVQQQPPDEAPRPGEYGSDMTTQKSVGVDTGVHERFYDYISREGARAGRRIYNHEVVFAALIALQDRYAEVVQNHRPKAPEGQIFARPVPGRRSGPPRYPRQINFRPSLEQRREITRLAKASGADSDSEFLNALLAEFLPPARRQSRQQQ